MVYHTPRNELGRNQHTPPYKDQYVGIKMSNSLLGKVKDRAERMHQSMSRVIRDCIRRGILD